MNREEILAKSRNENQNRDIYELEVIRKGQRIAGLIGLSVTFALMFVERVILDSGMNYGYFLIILSAATGLWLYKAVKLKRKHEAFLAVLWAAFTIYAGAMVVLGFMG